MFTVGHSTRSIPEFVTLLQAGRIDLVVDIRSTPRSRSNPQFNLDALPDALADSQIGHTRIAELGGRRNKSKSISPQTNAFWIKQSFHNYADYALSDEFQNGLAALAELSRQRRCAIMCSEALWWRCHRRFVADYLLHDKRSVFHLMGTTHIEVAIQNSAARASGASLVYPASESPGCEMVR